MIIDEAYCVEMKKVVDIYSAQNYFFENEFDGRLLFYCSFRKCTSAEVKVTGINYDKSVEKAHKFKEPHFRRNSSESHHKDCIWEEIRKVLKEIEGEAKQEKIVGQTKLKSSDYIAIFNPKSKNTNKDSSFYTKLKEDLKGVSDQKTRNKIIKNYYLTSEPKTDILRKVVSCYLALQTKEKRQNVPLRIGKLIKGNFYSTFKNIGNYNLNEEEKFIYYGKAKVIDKNYGYRIEFQQGEKETNEIISIFVTKYALNKYSNSNYLARILEKANESKSYNVDCYFWGKISNKKNPDYIDVELDHLDNVVLKFNSTPSK